MSLFHAGARQQATQATNERLQNMNERSDEGGRRAGALTLVGLTERERERERDEAVHKDCLRPIVQFKGSTKRIANKTSGA